MVIGGPAALDVVFGRLQRRRRWRWVALVLHLKGVPEAEDV